MLLAIVALAFGAACRSQTGTPAVAVTADTYAVVNGRQIMRADVDKAFQRAQPSSQVASEAETLAAKLNVLDELIVEDLLLAKAKELKLEVAGLMCIPPHDEEPAIHFAFLAKLAQELGLKELSMGMSADFETAVRFGATSVRVGSALFGARS